MCLGVVMYLLANRIMGVERIDSRQIPDYNNMKYWLFPESRRLRRISIRHIFLRFGKQRFFI